MYLICIEILNAKNFFINTCFICTNLFAFFCFGHMVNINTFRQEMCLVLGFVIFHLKSKKKIHSMLFCCYLINNNGIFFSLLNED